MPKNEDIGGKDPDLIELTSLPWLGRAIARGLIGVVFILMPKSPASARPPLASRCWAS